MREEDGMSCYWAHPHPSGSLEGKNVFNSREWWLCTIHNVPRAVNVAVSFHGVLVRAM